MFSDCKAMATNIMLTNVSVSWRKQLAVSDCFFGYASEEKEASNRDTMFQRRDAIC